MYKIIKDGEAMGMTEAPNYIKQAENGCFAICQEAEAQGIVHNGTPYHLLGREAMDGVETVTVEETDAGAQIMDMQGTIDELVIVSLEGGIGNV